MTLMVVLKVLTLKTDPFNIPTRYADDFLVGIVGPRKFAVEIRDKINSFLKSNLHL